MPSFCVKCGAPLDDGLGCVKCSAASASPVNQTQTQALPAVKAGMSPLAKFGIATVLILFVGGAVGLAELYYAAHRVGEEIYHASSEALGMNGDEGGKTNHTQSATGRGNPCRLLRKEDVSRAIGVPILRTETEGGEGCSYIAKGTQADMMAKHASAMTALRGADPKTQQTIQNIAGGMFKVFASEQPPSEQDTSGEVPVFTFSVDPNAAQEQFELNQKSLGILGDSQSLKGIGDQAFVSADGMMMVRKGGNLVRIIYLTCPCNTDAVKPLAKEIADAL